jgi:hypothetical protein
MASFPALPVLLAVLWGTGTVPSGASAPAASPAAAPALLKAAVPPPAVAPPASAAPPAPLAAAAASNPVPVPAAAASALPADPADLEDSADSTDPADPADSAASPDGGAAAAGTDGMALPPAAIPAAATPARAPVFATPAAALAGLYSPLGSPLYDFAGTADPWTVLPRTSGVLMTRAYVAGYGARPGELFVGPGSTGDQGVFRIEGFEVGDAASPSLPLGVSALTAQQVEVTTGGANLAVLSPGLQVNLVQRRGTNEWRATARGLGSGGPLAGGAPRAHGLAPGQAESEDTRGDRVRDAGTVGAELGGPLRQDALWLWGALDRGWTALGAFGGQPVTISDLGGAAKLDARLSAANSATLAWDRARREEDGEGAGPDRLPATTLDRRAHDDVWRLTDTAILSSSLYLTGTGGLVGADAQALPRGGLAAPLVLDAAGVAHGSWYADSERRNARAAALSVSDSGRVAGTSGELRFAGEWRQTGQGSRFAAPDWRQVTAGPVLDLPPNVVALAIWRNGDTRERLTRQALWAGETLRWDRATVDFGLRFDRQTPRNLPSSVPGVPGNPLLPAIAFHGNDAGGVRWSSLAPRLAAAWAPPRVRRLLLRASLARYASQLGDAIAARVNPAAPASAAYYAPASGADGNGQPAFWFTNGFDPRLPPGMPANALDRRLRPELTDEAILGAEHSLPGDGVVGLRLVYRRVGGVLEDRLLVRDAASGAVWAATASDWVFSETVSGNLPNGAAYSVPYYDLRPGLAPTGGTLLTNGDRRQRLLGATLEWRRRLARRWTTRGQLAWQSWTWQIGPRYLRYADPSPTLVDGSYQGQPVGGQSNLPGGRPLYLASRWSFDLGGAVQLPGALAAAIEINGRQGFPLAWYRTIGRDQAGPVDLRLVDRVDRFRSDDLVSLNARLDKEIAAGPDLAVAVSLEALNLLTSGQVLRRETNLGVGRANFVDEVVTPRLLRLGLKLQFR